MQSRHSLQQGYILLVSLVILVVGAAVWFGQGGLNIKSQRSYYVEEQKQLHLLNVKNKLLDYLVLTPEILQNDNASSPPSLNDLKIVPGPGYLPNCDSNGDGKTNSGCTGADYHPMYLPRAITSRHLYFSKQNKEFRYILDAHFASQNSNYNNDSSKRYAPLNTTIVSDTNIRPTMHFKGDGRYCDANDSDVPYDPSRCYVAFIIDTHNASGVDVGLASVNNDGDDEFISSPSLNNRIIGISFQEWSQVVVRRVCNLADTLSGTTDNISFWFNSYRPDTDPNPNPTGSNWRSLVSGVCP